MTGQYPQASAATFVNQGPIPATSALAADSTLSEAWITLRKRRFVLIGVVLLGTIFGFYKAHTQARPYEAYGRIEVRAGSSNQYKINPLSSLGDDSQQNIQSEIAILTSDTLLQTVAREMNLSNNPTFRGAKGPIPHWDVDDPRVRQDMVNALQHNLKVTLVPKTDIIRISFSSLDPKLSADIINKLIADFIRRSYESRFDSTKRVSQWLSGQLDDLKHEVEVSQAQVLELGKKLGTLGFDATHNQIATSLDDLVKASGTVKLNRILAESRYRMLAGMDPTAIDGSIDSAPIGSNTATPVGLAGLRSNLATAKATLASLSATMGYNHPQVQSAQAEVDELERQVTAEQNRLLTQAKENYLIAKQNEEQTNAALESEKQNAYDLRNEQVQYTLRLREFESSRTLYEGLLQRLRTAGIEAGLASSEIDIIDAAVPPISPTIKPHSTVVLTWLFVGLIVGILLAFLLESLDTSLKSVAEIERVIELPSLAVVPRARRSPSEQMVSMSFVQRNLNVLTQPKSQFTEAFRSLRTALQLSATGREPKCIIFTSATPSEGKTTAAGNLAVILAQAGTRTLLIDADLRKPNVHHRFGLNGQLGLSTILSGQKTLEQCIQTVPEVPGLAILTSGPLPPFPTEMLLSANMTALMQRVRETYNQIVIDAPPILSVTDGVVLARFADAVVLIVRHGKSSRHVVRRARDILVRSGAPIAGIVLNAVDLNAPEYYGYYEYSYASLDATGWESKSEGKSRKDDDQ
jgi:succinoglycan biosynthesis transport protein ExoP